MTTILYDGRGGLHGDRLAGPERRQTTKVHRLRDGGLIGTSGCSGDAARLRRYIDDQCYGLRPDAWPDLPKPSEALYAIYVHHDGSVWKIDDSGYPFEVQADEPRSVGSGGDYVIAAFLATGSVQAAMAIAHRCDVGTGAEYDSVVLPRCDATGIVVEVSGRRLP